MLAKNAEKTLSATLDSVRMFSEVVLLDTGSTDKTLEIARRYPNVKIHTSPFYGFGPLRNDLAKLASHDWILALDCDEVISQPLSEEILSLDLDPNFGYAMERHNFYRGQRIYGCGWGGEVVARLYNRKVLQFSPLAVHEALQAKTIKTFTAPLLHTPYLSTRDFLHKMQHYSTLFAEEYKDKKQASFSKALSHAFFAFFRSYLLRRGIFDGKAGFTISLYNANTTFYKYLKLYEAQVENCNK
jgi:glycosyltransferase involved in cell wall biosynthesis